MANATGDAHLPDYTVRCDVFTLALAREVFPDLPDQAYDQGDGNCDYSSVPDTVQQGEDEVTWDRPEEDQPGFVDQVRARLPEDQANCAGNAGCVGVVGSDVAALGDSAFCTVQTESSQQTFVIVSWQRGSTGFGLEVFGISRPVTCAQAVQVAAGINTQI